MSRRRVIPEAVVSSLREALDARYRELDAERLDASPERVASIDAEQEAIEGRQAELFLAESRGLIQSLPELRRLGEPLPLATRVRMLTTPDGYRLETVDTGKRIT